MRKYCLIFFLILWLYSKYSSSDWQAMYCRDGVSTTISSSDAEALRAEIVRTYEAQKLKDPTASSLQVIDRLDRGTEDGQISVHLMIDELMAVDEILDNPLITVAERKNLTMVREILVSALRETGQNNADFLEKFDEAERVLAEYRRLAHDPDILRFYAILAENGWESAVQFLESVCNTDDGRKKIEEITQGTPMDGRTFLQYLAQRKGQPDAI